MKQLSVGLLARLLPESRPMIVQYQSVLRRAVELIQLSETTEEECATLVKLVAGCSDSSNEFVALARETRLTATLMRLLPDPRRDGHEFTAASVCLPPANKITPTFMGNICKTLIPLMGIDELVIPVVSELGVAKLICCLSNQSNPLVSTCACIYSDLSGGFCPDPVGDAADAFDGNGDDVAVLEEQLGVSAVSGSGRRAREDDVSWFQGGEFGDGGDECGYVEDQVGEVGFLYHVSVQRCADAGLADVGFRGGDDVGPEWVVLSQALPCSHWWDLFW